MHLDTTMVGTAFSEAMAPLPADWLGAPFLRAVLRETPLRLLAATAG